MAKQKNPPQISEEARRLRIEYQRAWRKKNPDKVRAQNKAYWERRAARMAAELAGAVQDQTDTQSAEPLEDQTEAPTGQALTARDGAETIDPDDMTESRLEALVEYKRAATEGATV